MAKRKFENPESTICQSETSMHFWGVCCESGKYYTQVVGQRFRITMAVLDPISFRNGESVSPVSLMVIRNGIEYLLCVLKQGYIQQVTLNLIFDKGEKVKFFINGEGRVYLSGYQLTDSEGDVLNDENGYLCPLVEEKPKGKRGAKGNASNLSHAMSGRSSVTERLIRQQLYSDDEDEDDDDYQVADEVSDSECVSESECNEDSLSDELRMLEEGDTEEKGTSDDTEELSENTSDEEEINQNSHDSRKRKKQKQEFRPTQKRSKNSRLNSSFLGNSDDVGLGGTEYNEMNSATSSTPMPSVKANSEKKSKKKKRLSEISNTSNLSNKKSPTGAKESKVTHPVIKLENGVEIQDVIIGKGPEARKGKVVHVFYIGRYPDKNIFDSRLPPKKPYSFKLGDSQILKGWNIGLEGMKVGGKRKIKVPPAMGYGKAGNESIPPNTTLFFVVELNSVS